MVYLTAERRQVMEFSELQLHQHPQLRLSKKNMSCKHGQSIESKVLVKIYKMCECYGSDICN